MHRKAFTLVELLVVISIIGLLSTVAVVSLGSARQKSRNTKRVTDIKQLVTAFSLAYDTNGSFPDSSASSGGFACVAAACTGSWASPANATVDAIMFPTFMGQKPLDPTDGLRSRTGYRYNNNYAGTTSLVDGFVFTAGPVLLYALEQPATCVLGHAYVADTNRIECFAALDQRF